MDWAFWLIIISGLSILTNICCGCYHCFIWYDTDKTQKKTKNSPSGTTTPRSPTQAMTEPRRRPPGTWSRINFYFINHIFGRQSDEEQSNDNKRAVNDDHSTVVDGSDFEDIFVALLMSPIGIHFISKHPITKRIHHVLD